MAKTTGRREWLSTVARGAAAATAGVLGLPNAARSDENGADPRIKHIVVLMMENRSFDHMLGLLMKEIPDLRGVRTGDWTNVDDKGNVHPLTDDAEYQGQLRVDPPHDFWSMLQQIYGRPGPQPPRPTPDMQGFAVTYERAGGNPAHVMRCFRPERLPPLSALARNYLVCDNWFSSVPGPTNPNRAFAHFSTSFGRVDNGPMWVLFVNGRHEKGIYGRLRDRGKSAKIYYYSLQSGTIGMTFLGSSYFGLYRDFVRDCRNNRLPDYAFIEPPYVDQDDGTLAADQHPDNFVLAGDHFIRTVYEAIRSNDEVWRSTLFLIVWDEHGGLFDHVSPPTLPYRDSFRSPVAGFDFDQLGVRVPAIVVSPYVTPGVSHALFEHASIPATATRQFIGPPATHARYLRELCPGRGQSGWQDSSLPGLREAPGLSYGGTPCDKAVFKVLGARRARGGDRRSSLRLGWEGVAMSVPKEIGHIVLNVTDVERSTRFYRDVVGFQVSRYRPDGTGAFLTCGVVHHNLALFKAPAGARPTEKGAIGLNHFAFKVESYRALQAAHSRLVEARAAIDHIVDHGMTRSVYFLDPDGIMMELFSDTYATEEEGLAYMKSTRGGAAPMDITAAEPPRAEIPQADFTRVG